MAQSTRGSGKMVYLMEEASVSIPIEVVMRDDGRMDSLTGLEKKKIVMALFMMVIGSMERHREKAKSN